jgi:hypothetical protein
MPDLTPAEVAAALKLCEAATPGPWVQRSDGWTVRTEDEQHMITHTMTGNTRSVEQQVNDSDFIAAARTLLPRALKDWMALREENERLAAERDAYKQLSGVELEQELDRINGKNRQAAALETR